MTYEVLARKWRPQRFEEVVGQEHVTRTLINAIQGDRLSHAYLFSGPRGVGKTSVARILAKAVNCEQGQPGQPCNRCRSCLEITDGSSVDVQEIDGASNRGIDEIRDLRENIRYMPAASRYRVYIIDEVHMLTLPAFNALLKTLEEPPPHVKFIFATTEFHKVPVTILSRCQRFDFRRIPTSQIISHLERVSKEEGVRIAPSGLALIGRQAEGSMRDAESLLDQVVSFTGKEVTDRHITEILGIVDRDLIFQSSLSIIEGSAARCLDIVDRLYLYGHDIKEFYRNLMEQFRNLLVSLVASEGHLLDMTEEDRQETRRQAGMAGFEKLQAVLNFLIAREESLRFSTHPRLLLEATMVKLCQMGEFLSFGEILARIESLEHRLPNSSSGACAAVASRVSDPEACWAVPGEDAVREEAGENALEGRDWDGFLSFVASRNMGMANILKEWEPRKLDEKELELSCGDQPFSSAYFSEPARYQELCRCSREYFGAELRIRLVGGKDAQRAKGAAASPSAPSGTGGTDLSPPVQDLLQAFEGEIQKSGSGGGQTAERERR